MIKTLVVLLTSVLIGLTVFLVIDSLNPLTKTEIQQGDTCLILETYRVVGPTVYFC